MKMKAIDSSFLSPKQKYPFKIYLQISDAKMIVLFNEETILEPEDIEKINQYLSNNKKVLLTKEDYTKHLVKDAISDNKINQQAAHQLAFHALERQDDLNDKDYLDQVVENTNSIVRDILDQGKGKQNDLLIKILKDMESSKNIYMNHANQVFAIAVTFLFLLPANADIEQLYDLGQGALLHGFALNYMDNPKDKTFLESFPIDLDSLHLKADELSRKKIITAHRIGHTLKTFDDISIYLESFEIMEKASATVKKNLSRGVPKMISDFKLLQIPKGLGLPQKTNPYVSAKVLLIADHVISIIGLLIQNSSSNITDTIFIDALEELKTRHKTDKNSASYDFSLIKNFISKLSGT